MSEVDLFSLVYQQVPETIGSEGPIIETTTSDGPLERNRGFSYPFFVILFKRKIVLCDTCLYLHEIDLSLLDEEVLDRE